jgi:ElaB/YqjD/DUF883 family membrane-anchored ribosome-binding protein
LHSIGSTPRVRGAAFFGVRRRTGARLRFALVLVFVATLDPPRFVQRRVTGTARTREALHLRCGRRSACIYFRTATSLSLEIRRMRNNGALHSPLKNLRKDLYAVARDAEALLKATAEVTNDRVQEVRSRTEKTLRAAMEHLSDDRLRAQVRRVAETTDGYVHERPWAVIGAAAGVGLLIGLLLRRD